MNPIRSWKRWRAKERLKKARKQMTATPLREFVYLDEVSLRSLLSSQTGEMTESKSEQVLDALTVDVGAKIAGDSYLAKAELASKFQTANSSTLQTSRKATVQSWFREFHDLPGLRLIQPNPKITPATNAKELLGISDTSALAPASVLERGALVEFRVALTADPVFHLGTMVSEFSGMASDFPELFQVKNADATLREMERVNKILQRLLAGLIPVRGNAVDYKVVAIDGVEYVVHKEACAALNLDQRPLEIVGVTEHLAYWKDIRRVLFSSAEFTVLCRISKSGLHDSWTPVKLADLFQHLTPDLVEQLNAAGKLPFVTVPSVVPAPASTPTDVTRFADSLRIYATQALNEMTGELTAEQARKLEQEIDRAQNLVATASDQRSGFLLIERLLTDATGVALDPARNLELRNIARAEAGVSLFPALAREESVIPAASIPRVEENSPRLLDVEVVAIYW